MALLVVALVGGCPRKPSSPPPPVVAEVRVSYRGQDAAGAPNLDLGKLQEAARAAITASSTLPVREDGGADARRDPKQKRYRLRVELEIGAAEDTEAKRGNLRALVVARLQPIGGDPTALAFEQTALAERAGEVREALLQRCRALLSAAV
jgi:hypothetical protein